MTIFIKDEFQFKIRDDISVITREYETLWIEVEKCDKLPRQTLIGVIYRVPGTDPEPLNKYLDITLKIINKSNYDVYHMGDYNLDLIKHETHHHTSEFVDINLARELLPTITKPTRVSTTSSTLIDNIFMKFNSTTTLEKGILVLDISDHFPIFIIVPNEHKKKS